MKKLLILLAALLIPLSVVPASAVQIRVFVTDMNALGVQNRDEMKATLQMLLASRLTGDKTIAVSSAGEADVLVSGTYVTIGKIFSVDALAKTAAGKTLTRAFVQGESQDELIPAVGKLADKLSADLARIYSGALPEAGTAVMPIPAAKTLTPVKSDFIKNEQQVNKTPAAEFIKPHDFEQGAAGGWLSKRLTGAANLLAVGKTLLDGSREIFLAENRRLSYYRQSADMKLVAEIELGNSEKILSLDTMENGDGSLDIYLTILRSEELSSQVWQVKGDKLVLAVQNLPYFFRSFSLAGGPKKLYAQAMGREEDFFSTVSEAVRNGSAINLKNPIKMPRFGNIYGFNQFRDRDGTTHTIVINPDGYLVVYSQEMKEMWRSNDKFGGSELYFQKDDDANVRVTGDKRWVFMNQRIQVSSKGEILVGKNDGFWVLGNARSYKKGAVYCFTWDGSSLSEKWRTRDTQNYMPDYQYDEAHNELIILQTVQRPGITTRGASSLAIKKVE
ncbi:MAG: VCBS repeat-containing protein [Desulfuromonadales bacterium]|nr:VCBS repeat-containing protein [Desulfuromonadales bacterium]